MVTQVLQDAAVDDKTSCLLVFDLHLSQYERGKMNYKMPQREVNSWCCTAGILSVLIMQICAGVKVCVYICVRPCVCVCARARTHILVKL